MGIVITCLEKSMSACFFGRYLVAKSLVQEQQLIHALDLQNERNKSLGTLAIERNWLTDKQVQSLNIDQRHLDRYLGELAFAKGWLNRGQLDELLAQQRLHNTSIGTALIELGALKASKLADLLADYHYTRELYFDECMAKVHNTSEPILAKLMINELIKAFSRFFYLPVALSGVHFGRIEGIVESRVVMLRVSVPSGTCWVELTLGEDLARWLIQQRRLANTSYQSEDFDEELTELLSQVLRQSCERASLRDCDCQPVALHPHDESFDFSELSPQISVELACQKQDFQLLFFQAQ